MIERFVTQHTNAHAYASLGSILYLSCMTHVDGVVGNSSSGLLEAPSFRKGTINIGDRQQGRLQADSVINAAPTRESIAKALEELYSIDFQASLKDGHNPYGEGGASEKIVNTIKKCSLNGIIKKEFYDVLKTNTRK